MIIRQAQNTLKKLWAVEGLSDSEFSAQAYKISYGFQIFQTFF